MGTFMFLKSKYMYIHFVFKSSEKWWHVINRKHICKWILIMFTEWIYLNCTYLLYTIIQREEETVSIIPLLRTEMEKPSLIFFLYLSQCIDVECLTECAWPDNVVTVVLSFVEVAPGASVKSKGKTSIASMIT